MANLNGRQFIARVRKWARNWNLRVSFGASAGAGSNETLHANDRRAIVKGRKRELGAGLLKKMLADLRGDRDEFRGKQ